MGATLIRCDNKSTIAIAKNLVMHGRTKRINIRFHFFRDLVSTGVIELLHYSTEEQTADIFTKPLSVQKHNYMRSRLGICDFESREGVEK